MIRHLASPWFFRVGLFIILVRVSYTVVAEANAGRNYRLVDSPSTRPNIGRVQIQQDGYWTDACFLDPEGNEDWDSNNLTMACEQLGYPGALNNLNISDICKGDSTCSPETKYTNCPENVYVQAVCATPGYVGCFYEEFVNSNIRLLPDHPRDAKGEPRLIDDDGMTIKKCINTCQRLGDNIRYAGLESRRECYCGTASSKYLFQLHRKNDSECEYPCSGDALDVCGGEFRLSIYDITLGKCNDPGVPNNGHIINSVNPNGTYAFGDVIMFGCTTSFVLEGYPSIQCVLGSSSAESVWNGSIPSCVEIGLLSTTQLPILTQLITTTKPAEPQESDIGVSVGSALGGLIAIILVIVLICVIIRKRRALPYATNNQADKDMVLPELQAGPRPSTDHQYSDVRNGSIQIDPARIEGNSSEPSNLPSSYANDDDVDRQKSAGRKQSDHLYADANKERKQSDQLYTYADKGRKQSDHIYASAEQARKQSEHNYAYADFKAALTKQTQGKSDNITSGETPEDANLAVIDEVSPEERWSDNILYSESSPVEESPTDNLQGSVPKQESEEAITNEQEGWSDNILYSESSPVEKSPTDNLEGSVLKQESEKAQTNDQEGWSDNILYSESSPMENSLTDHLEGSVPKQESDEAQTNEQEGWSENILYSKSGPYEDS